MNSFSNINYPVESFLDKLKNGNSENRIKNRRPHSRHKNNSWTNLDKKATSSVQGIK